MTHGMAEASTNGENAYEPRPQTRWGGFFVRSCPRCTIGAVEIDFHGPLCKWCGWAGPTRWEPKRKSNEVR